MVTEFYRKYRPRNFGEVVGQEQATKFLLKKLREKTLPHVILFQGPTGCGKTTLARITAEVVGCTDPNLYEIDCAEERGIDMVRNIKESIPYSPLGGSCRVWIFDEAVQLPKITQQAFLTVLEEVPEHVYFFFCSSDTKGLLPTFLSRCCQVTLESLSQAEISKILNSVVAEEEVSVSQEVLTAIPKLAQGSGRTALQILEAVLAVEGEEKQLAMLRNAVEGGKPEFLAKLLLSREKWGKITVCLEDLEDKDVEGMRRQVLAYVTKVLLGNSPQRATAYLIIQCFRCAWPDAPKASLAAACWEVSTGGGGT